MATRRLFVTTATTLLLLSFTVLWYYEPSAVQNFVPQDSGVTVMSNCSCTSQNEHLGRFFGGFWGPNGTNFTCPMSFAPSGRLGNLMGQYATLYALAKLNGRPAYITEEMSKEMLGYFQLSIPIVSNSLNISWTGYWIHDWMDPSYESIPCGLTMVSGYPSSWTFYHHLRDEIRAEFTFHSEIFDEVQSYLTAVIKNKKRNSVTFIGVHVRRGDYIKLMKELYDGVLADADFLQKATDYFRRKYSDAIFIVTSDDLDWVTSHMDLSKGDVLVGWNRTNKSAGKDMALLVNCNHTIMSMGTFGYWVAYLTGGEVVYMNNYTRPGSKFHDVFHYDAAYLPEWIPIDANLSSTGWQ